MHHELITNTSAFGNVSYINLRFDCIPYEKTSRYSQCCFNTISCFFHTFFLVPSVLVVGVCSDILDYQQAQSQPLFDLAVPIPPAQLAVSISQSGTCGDYLQIICLVLFPPLPPASQGLCQETCNQLLEGCPLISVFAPALSSDSCQSFPPQSEVPDGFCFGGWFNLNIYHCSIL